MSLPVVGHWLPDGPPTWIDVLVGAFAVVLVRARVDVPRRGAARH
jgi:hypothetical protein